LKSSILQRTANRGFGGRIRQGRSDAWYWRQVLTAVVVSFSNEISTHRLLAIKAMFTGWAASFLFQFVVCGMLSRFHLWLPLYQELPLFLGNGMATALTWLILWTPIWVCSSWFMSRLYRSHLTSMVLVFSITVLVWKLQRLPVTMHLLFQAVGNPRYFPQLVVELMNLILPTVCVVLGGFIASRSRCDYLSHCNVVTEVDAR
jgi:hypothetical protein